jgi:hypothetical protein
MIILRSSTVQQVPDLDGLELHESVDTSTSTVISAVYSIQCLYIYIYIYYFTANGL